MTDDIQFGDVQEAKPETSLRPDRNAHYAVVSYEDPEEREIPVFLDLDNRKAVIVGGCEEALRKARLLLKTKADIHVVAHTLHDELLAYLKDGRLTWAGKHFAPALLEDLVVQ